MPLIIDGYNLLHVTGLVGRGTGPGGLQRARNALINFLAESLSEPEKARTQVVFDAADPPPGLPRTFVQRGITIHFAEGYPDADSLVEELIVEETAPRRLTVVSSDHRVQRAARRRKAKAIDSDRWYAEVLRERSERHQQVVPLPARPGGELSADEVRYWLEHFEGVEEITDPHGAHEPYFPREYLEGLDSEFRRGEEE